MFYTFWAARVDRRRRKPVSIRRRRSLANTIKGDLMRILENRGNWYKGNLHMHTTMSDGVLDPVEAINVYREAGYDFIAITDHRKVGHLWQDNSFLILPGVEWDTGDAVNMPVYHILGIGMDRETVDFYHGAPYEGAPLGNTRAGMWVGGRTNRKRYYPHPQAIIEAVRAAGGIAILAHPAWSVMSPEEIYDLHGLSGAEIFNSVSGFPFNPGRDEASYYWDIWAKNGKLVCAFANDDTHYYDGEQTKAFTMVNAPALERDAIMEALRKGNFYASCGPKFHSIDYDPEQGIVNVKCSKDVHAVVFKSNTPWPDDAFQEINGSGQASYRIMQADRFVRIELVDREGRKAWCSPFAVGRR